MIVFDVAAGAMRQTSIGSRGVVATKGPPPALPRAMRWLRFSTPSAASPEHWPPPQASR